MAQDKVQLKREEVVGDGIVLQDINPKTKTNSITDSTKGLPLDQTLAMIKNMINNKLSRVVNSVNGKTGIVVIDAGDVGLENVDNVSFGDIKRWVINYIGDIFGTKRIILREYLSQIHEITGTNDKIYADVPFYVEKGNAKDNDYLAYIGYIYWDDTTSTLKEEHRQIKVIGYTDESLIYNVNAGTNDPNNRRNMSHGGLAVNILPGEDALKVKRKEGQFTKDGWSAEDLNNTGLYIDKSKLVPNTYFFDGVYGTLERTGDNMRNENALIYWSSIPHDTTYSSLPIVQIQINGEPIGMYGESGRVETLHLFPGLNLKFGDVILTNFAYDQYIDIDNTEYYGKLYPDILDSLTCRQPAIGTVIQAADMDTDKPCIINFHPIKPNVAHGLKLFKTNTTNTSTHKAIPEDTAIGLDLMESTLKMNDGTIIYSAGTKSNMSGINALDSLPLTARNGQYKADNKIYTVYPTGKSNNLLEDSGGVIDTNSTFIMPNFSLCVIPGYEFTQHPQHPISNWDGSSPMGGIEQTLPLLTWNMLGVNLEKKIFGTEHDVHAYARNISGLRVNTDSDSLYDTWFGFNRDATTSLCESHSGGLSVNVGDFLGIGTAEELSNTTPIDKSGYYDEGKVNVRIDKMKGLYGVDGNRLAINIAEGYIYQPTGTNTRTATWLEGGLKFLPNNSRTPDQGPITVNTGMGSSGLGVKNNYLVGIEGIHYGYYTRSIKEDNVLVVQPYSLFKTIGEGDDKIHIDNGIVDVSTTILEEDIVHHLPISYNSDKIWDNWDSMFHDYETGSYTFNEYHVYIAGGKRYVFWYEGGQPRFSNFMVYYSDETEYDLVMKSITNGVIDPAITWELNVDLLRMQCHVLIAPKDPTISPDEYNVKVSMYQAATGDIRLPDINHDGIVTAVDASLILSIYAEGASSSAIYTNADESEFFIDEELTTHVEPVEGRNYYTENFYQEITNYRNPSGTPYRYHMRYVGAKNASGTLIIKRRPVANYGLSNEILITFDDLINGDVNRDGRVDAADAGIILKFNTELSVGVYNGLPLEEAWRKFLREKLGINVEPGNGSVHTLLEYTFVKGTRVRYNELMGLTSNIEGYGSETIPANMVIGNSNKNSLSIKIADKSSGFETFDSSKFGGLRFGSEGYLAVRVNDKNIFSAWHPLKNNVLNYDNLSQGSRGLRIYNDNVLGIQLTVDGKRDNGELKIDTDGCLRLSGALKPDVDNLIISGKDAYGEDKSVSYNGDEELIIHLGHGLIIEE